MSDLHTILVVDDNEAGRYVKTRLLRQAGYRVIEAQEGYEALLCLRRDLPALVVLDILLPGIDGLEICRRIKRDPDTAHIMMLQASASRVTTEDRLAGLETGADAYLTEPFEPQELLATVKALLRLHDREQENRRLVGELRDSEARWRAWFDNSTCGMCQADVASGKLLRVNPYFGKLLGYTEAELIGRTVFEITHAEDREESRLGFGRLARGELAELRLETRHLKKDGAFVWTEVTVNVIRDRDGRPRRTVALVQEISRRKRHEQGRALLLAVTRRIVESRDGDGAVSDAIFEQVSGYLDVDICFNYRLDPADRRLRLVNSKGIAAQWLPASQELAVGQAFCGAAAAELRPLVADAEGIASDERGALVRAMGARAYACHPLLGRGGEVLGTLSFASTRRDRFDPDEIHLMHEIAHVLALAWERRRAEAAAQRWQRLFEQSDFSLAHVDAQSDSFIAVNAAFARERGYTPEELAGQSLLTIYPAELHAGLVNGIAKADESGHELFETYHRRKDGSVFPVLLEINSFKSSAGAARERIVYALDISAPRAVEEALRASENQLRLVTDNLPIYIAYCDAERRFRFVNQPYAERFGVAPAEVLGKRIEEVVGAAAYGSFRHYVEAVLDGRTVEFEQTVPYESGRREMRCAYIPEVGADGRTRGFYALIQDVTAQKIAEKQRAQLAAIVTTSRDAIISFSPDGRILTWNRAAERLLGWSESEAMGQPKSIFVPEQKIAESAKIFARTLRGDAVRQVDTVRRRRDGTPIDVSVTLSPVRINGEVVAISEVVRDITERKRWEEDLSYQTNLLRTVTDNVRSCLLMMDRQGRATFANAATERVTGFAPQELIGAVLHDRLHHRRPDGTPYAREDCPIDRLLPEFAVVENFEETFVHKDGRFYPVRCSARPIIKDGAPSGTVIEVQDISAEKQAQAAISASEARLRLALESAGAGMWDLDLTSGAMVWSPENCRLYGIEPEQFVPQYGTWRAAVHPQDIARIEAERGANVGADHPYRVEYRIRKPSGEVRWLVSHGRGYHDETGKPVRMLGINIDITERKHLETLLTQRVEELREADRAKDHFLALLSHELRNPLAPITNAAALLRRTLPDDPNQRWCVDVIEGQLSNMARMLEDLLDVSRITRGKLELRRQPIELAPVLRQALQTSRPLIDLQEHQMEVELPAKPVWIDGDATRLAQVIANLLNNAAKYTEPGGRIALRMAAQGATVKVSVSDNGHGIAAELLPKVFDLFTQGDDRPKSGLGIGLTVCKNLIEMHGGKIEASSAGLERGSEFIVSLDTIAAPADAAPDNGATRAPLPGPALRILVVDDNREHAATLGALLTAQGHQARVANNGTGALVLAAEFAPEVALIDLGMPDMDGCELARRLRAQPRLRDAVLIAQTGWGRADDRERTKDAGFHHHLVKPLNHDVLEALLLEIGSRQRQSATDNRQAEL